MRMTGSVRIFLKHYSGPVESCLYHKVVLYQKKLINSTTISFFSVTMCKKETECNSGKYYRVRALATSPPEGKRHLECTRRHEVTAFPKIF